MLCCIPHVIDSSSTSPPVLLLTTTTFSGPGPGLVNEVVDLLFTGNISTVNDFSSCEMLFFKVNNPFFHYICCNSPDLTCVNEIVDSFNSLCVSTLDSIVHLT